MNNRYKELAEQTGFRHDNGEWQFASDSEVEKFAELIVRKCSAAIMENSDRHRKEYFADLVLKHFEISR